MRIRLALGLAAALAAAAPAAAQTICGTGPDGAVDCRGMPAARWTPFAEGRGLGKVQRPRPVETPQLVPAWRRGPFGDTWLRPGEEPGAGGRCRRDTLGNLVCG